MTIEEVVENVEQLGCNLVELTGGEPLLQEEVFDLTTQLLDRGFEVLIETSGAHSIECIDPRAKIILDIKCPGSGMTHAMEWDNIKYMKTKDEIKFVIADRTDYQWASSVVAKQSLSNKNTVLFSPVFSKMDPQKLAQWILEDHLPVRFHLQLHKYIWNPNEKGV